MAEVSVRCKQHHWNSAPMMQTINAIFITH